MENLSAQKCQFFVLYSWNSTKGIFSRYFGLLRPPAPCSANGARRCYLCQSFSTLAYQSSGPQRRAPARYQININCFLSIAKPDYCICYFWQCFTARAFAVLRSDREICLSAECFQTAYIKPNVSRIKN